MEFIKLDIYTESAALEPLIVRLGDMGVGGFEIHDADDFNDFLENSVKNWDYVGDELNSLKTQETRLTLYLTNDSQGEKLLAEIYDLCACYRIEKSAVREEDWADCWKEYFKPFEIGEKLLVKPTWENAPKTERLILEIDPASAFGTGRHESTKLCLETLEKLIAPCLDYTFLDLGCGSGILTVAALLLGAKSAVMADVSENALRIARLNAKQNGFGEDKYRAFCGDITENEDLMKQIGGGFDIIAANIVADVIINMSGLFPRLLSKSGFLVVSGIIGERLKDVSCALESAGLKILETKEDNDWFLLRLKNQKTPVCI